MRTQTGGHAGILTPRARSAHAPWRNAWRLQTDCRLIRKKCPPPHHTDASTSTAANKLLAKRQWRLTRTSTKKTIHEVLQTQSHQPCRDGLSGQSNAWMAPADASTTPNNPRDTSATTLNARPTAQKIHHWRRKHATSSTGKPCSFNVSLYTPNTAAETRAQGLTQNVHQPKAQGTFEMHHAGTKPPPDCSLAVLVSSTHPAHTVRDGGAQIWAPNSEHISNHKSLNQTCSP